MARIILLQGGQWQSPKDHYVVNRFHSLAQQNGSEAVWLPTNGVLMTRDASETAKDFPYEEWLETVMYECPQHADQQNPAIPRVRF